MKESDWLGITSIIIICLIAIAISVVALSNKPSKEEKVIDLIVECYEESNQCGLHNIIEESEYEDGSINMVLGWLEENRHNLPEHERTKGIEVAKYLQALTYEERSELLNKAFKTFMRRQMP